MDNKVIKEFKSSVKNGELEFNFCFSSIPATRSIEVTHKDMPMPVGILWYGFKGNKCVEIYQSFVIDIARRCGVRTFMHKLLLNAYPFINSIITGSSNKYSKGWLIKNGFKQTKDGDWILKIKQNN